MKKINIKTDSKNWEDAKKAAKAAAAAFGVKMENINVFTPNKSTHPEFAHGLEYTQNCGVKILCLDCIVTPDTLKANKFIDYIL